MITAALLLLSTPALAGSEMETCFTPSERCEAKLVNFLKHAKRSIDVAVFDLNLDPVAEALVAQSKKAKVRVLVDRRQAKGKYSLIPHLICEGVPVRFGVQSGLMHSKTSVIDTKFVATGSFNYTWGAAKRNQEDQVYIYEEWVAKRFRDRFDQAWEKGRKVTPEEREVFCAKKKKARGA